MNSTLILSDTHIGEKFAKERFDALMQLCEKYNQIILNGDFLDDFWEYKKTIHSQWAPLFELLKTKKTIYLFGNHDRDSSGLRRISKDFISHYANTYVLPVAKKELVIMHGHTIYPRHDGILYSKKQTLRGKLFQKFMKILWNIVYPIILILRLFIERYPKTLAQLQRPIIKHQNERMKLYAENNLETHQILVCGHSHLQEDARDDKFINTGANCYDRLEYISIIDEKIEVKKQAL